MCRYLTDIFLTNNRSATIIHNHKSICKVKIKKILVSQPQPANGKSPYFDLAKQHGVEIVFRPFIKVEGLSSKEFRQQKVSILDFSAIIFTAKTAVDHFFRLAEEMRLTIPETMRYFCSNEQIALYLQKYTVYRKRKIFFPETGKFADLVPSIVKHNKDKYLFVTSNVPNGEIEMLNNGKVNYTQVMMYRTVSNDFGPDEAFDYDMLVFFSPAGIASLKKNFPNFEQGDLRIAAYGTTTAKAVEDEGLRLDLAAPTPQTPSMTAALDAYLKEHKQESPLPKK